MSAKNTANRASRRAFTLVELIFSIVILAILSMITADIVSHIYSRYIMSKEIERAQSDMRRTLDMIGNRLSYRVKNSAIGRDIRPEGSPRFKENHIIAIDDYSDFDDYEMFQWVGIAHYSMRGQSPKYPTDPLHPNTRVLPGWSGIHYLDGDAIDGIPTEADQNYRDNAKAFIMPLGNMTIAKKAEYRHYLTINPGYNADWLNNNDPFSLGLSVMVLAGSDLRGDTSTAGSKVDQWGWRNIIGNATDLRNYFKMIPASTGDMNFTLLPVNSTDAFAFVPRSYSAAGLINHYIVNGAYALWVDENATLKLAYDIHPWLGDYYDYTLPRQFRRGTTLPRPPIPERAVLQDVTRFRLQETGGVLRIVLCVRPRKEVLGIFDAQDNDDTNATQFCREKVVL
ncbi:MAG: prepilin-type N-terminal cleavage/methylation domain-containing protein [Helicobacteraceae bacterium]|jgi:prepilin-type N-terminal cleavage/methylation domain-containing protein|nr:prepilin-type N-terminal cleavage/methylation domain-containing protein [Helicobacteraceae bacterium]